MTYDTVGFHLPIGLSMCEAVQVILDDLAILGGYYIPIQHTNISKKVNRIPNIFEKIINKDQKKDRT